MQPTLLNAIRDGIASVFCCGNTHSSPDRPVAPIALALHNIANAHRTGAGVTVNTTPDATAKQDVQLNDDDKKNIVRQFHRDLTRSRYTNSTSHVARETRQTLDALSKVDKSWRAACADECAVARVSDIVMKGFNDNFDRPIESIQYINRTIKSASLRGQAALEIVDAALRRSVSEADIYENYNRPAKQRQMFPYDEILRDVLALQNVEPKIMNIIIAKACNIFWGGPTVYALGLHECQKLDFSTALLDTMLSHVAQDLPDASRRTRPLALRNLNIHGGDRVCVKWPTLCEMTKVAAGIHLRESEAAAKTALTKILDCNQRAPIEHRINVAVGIAAYSDAFLDRRAYVPFKHDVAPPQKGERTVDFIFTSIKARLTKAEFKDFMTQLNAEPTVSADVKARAYIV